MKIIFLTLLSLAAGKDIFALDFQILGGAQSLDSSEILGSGSAKGSEAGVRLSFDIIGDSTLSSGVFATQSSYKISRETTENDAIYKHDGTFGGTGYGVDFRINLPLFAVQPYLRLAYVFTQYSYELDSSTSYTAPSGNALLTTMASLLELQSRGAESGIGLMTEWGSNYVIFAEYLERRETLEVQTANLDFANFSDGIEQPLNAGAAEIINDFRKLYGDKMMHSTTTFLMGVGLRFR